MLHQIKNKLVIVINQLMLSVSLGPKVITLCHFQGILKFKRLSDLKFYFQSKEVNDIFLKILFGKIKDFIQNSQTMISLVHNNNGIIIKKYLPSHLGEKD